MSLGPREAVEMFMVFSRTGCHYLGEVCLAGAAIPRDTDCYRGSGKTSDRFEDVVERAHCQ